MKIAAYVADGRHMSPRGSAKTIREIADDLGIHPATVRHELRRNNYALWVAHWAPLHVMFPETLGASSRSFCGEAGLIDQLPKPDRDAITEEEEERARYR